MLRRLTAFVALALCSVAGFMPGTVGTSHAQNRHIMLEEFTGSWCGWCPRGAYAIQQIDKKYPGQVFAVAVHNGDPMTTPSGDSLQMGIPGLAAQSAIPGFPGSWVARTGFGASNSWIQDPSNWVNMLPGIDTLGGPGLVDQMVNKPTDVAVTVDNVTFDPASHMVSCKVNAKFINAVTGEVRLNLYVTEDSVIGPSGSLYDQHCYYSSASNGNAFPNNPWYSGPAVIPGWPHMHVLRTAVGGAWGIAKLIPNGPAAGSSYSQSFTFKLPTAVTDPNHVHLIGFVHQFSTSDAASNVVLDAAEATLSSTHIPVVTANFDMQPEDGNYIIANANGDTTENVTITNHANKALTLDLAIDASKLPAGWATVVTPTNITIPALGSLQVAVKFTAPDQSALASAALQATPIETGKYANTVPISISALSNNTLYGAYYYNVEKAMVTGLSAMPDSIKKRAAYLPINADVIGAYDPSQLFRLAVYSDPQILDGTYNGLPSLLGNINAMLANGKKVFISSNEAGPFAYAGPAATQTSDVQSFFTDTLGLTYKSFVSHVSGNSYTGFTINGTKDPISNNLTLSANANGAVAGSSESAVFKADTTGGTKLLFTFDAANNGKAAGIRYENAIGARLVYLDFNLNCLGSQSAATGIFTRSINWLLAPPPANSATVGVAGGAPAVKFGATAPITWTIKGTVGPTVDIDLSMDGKQTWSSVAKGVASTTGSYAWTVPGFPSNTACIRLTFSDGYVTWSPLFAVNSAGGVSYIASTGKDLTAMPNPFHGMTQVRYTAATAGNVTFSAVDLLGREIAQIPASQDGDAFVANFDASKLSAGTYVIMAHAADGVHQLRVVNTK